MIFFQYILKGAVLGSENFNIWFHCQGKFNYLISTVEEWQVLNYSSFTKLHFQRSKLHSERNMASICPLDGVVLSTNRISCKIYPGENVKKKIKNPCLSKCSIWLIYSQQCFNSFIAVTFMLILTAEVFTLLQRKMGKFRAKYVIFGTENQRKKFCPLWCHYELNVWQETSE